MSKKEAYRERIDKKYRLGVNRYKVLTDKPEVDDFEFIQAAILEWFNKCKRVWCKRKKLNKLEDLFKDMRDKLFYDEYKGEKNFKYKY